MLLSKKSLSKATSRKARRSLKQQLEYLFPEKNIDITENTTALLIDTSAVITHFTVTHTWQADHLSELQKTIERSINSEEATFLDPLDTALHAHATDHAYTKPKHGPVRTLPFDQSHALSGNVWHYGNTYELAIKGAPEHILAKCDLTENERELATRKLHQFAGEGRRVVAFAHATVPHNISSFNDLTKNDLLAFDGFVSLTQHFSPRVKTLVKTAHEAGLTVYLVTGDHSESALHIAKELGIASRRSQIFDSRRIHVMTNDELSQLVKDVRVFCRTTAQNRALISAQFKQNEVLELTSPDAS